MRWLIAGDMGFIGQNLRAMLEEWGHDVLGYDLARSTLQNIMEPISEAGFMSSEVVVNLAAVSGIPACELDPAGSAPVNTLGAYLLATQAPKDCTIVHFASQAVFAEGELNHYMIQKRLSIIALAQACKLRKDIRSRVLFPANVYGPHSQHKTSAVHAWIRAGLRGDPLLVHGDGSQTRDFVHVDEVCRKVLRSVKTTGLRPYVHACTGVQTPIVAVARLIADRLGARIQHVDARDHEVLLQAPAASSSEVEPALVEGIDRTIEWYRQQEGITCAF